jgi:hypothetical protein
MLDQMFEAFRKTAETSLQMQQEMFRRTVQQWSWVPSNASAAPDERAKAFAKRWVEFTTDSLNKQRESLDAMYKSGIEVFEQAMRLSDAKSPEEYRRMAEDFWRKMFEVGKYQSEIHLRDFEKGVEKWMELFPKAKA